ncbi:MAG: hypothetical protein RKH07_12680 [Gammaproteobacteria bacterium]
MNLNIKPSDQMPLVGVIDPDLNTAGALSTGWISMADFAWIMAVIAAGTLGSSATLDAKIEEATNSSGGSAQDLSGKAITQLTQAGTDESDKQAIINVSAEDLSDGFTHVRLTMTVATASSDSTAMVFGMGARYQPAADLASVAEIV